MRKSIFHLATGTALALALSVSTASAQKKYDTGATDTEIKIGQTNPFSGPASAYATIGKTQAAYIKMINDQGGVNGRKINLIQYDDAYSPPKAVEQVRKLVESDEVLLTFQLLGTPSNAAVQKYLNPRRCRSCSPPPAPRSSPTRRISRGRWASTPTTSSKGASTASTSSRISKRQDRNPLSERRARQGVPERHQSRPRRQGGQDDRGGSVLRSRRSDHQIAILKIKDAGADLFFSARHRSRRRKRSRRSPKSAGTRCTSSTSTPPRSAR